MLKKQYIEKIQQAVSDHLGTPVKLEITAETNEKLSPQQQQDHDNKVAQDQREQTILKDNNVQKIMETFDATVIKESITTISDN